MADHKGDPSLQELAVKIYGHELPPQDLSRLRAVIQDFPELLEDLLECGAAKIPLLHAFGVRGEERIVRLQKIRRLMDIDSSCLLVQDSNYENLFIRTVYGVYGKSNEIHPAVLDLLEQMVQAQPSLLFHESHRDHSFQLQQVIGELFPTAIIDLILRHAPHLARSRDEHGQLPLHRACANGSSVEHVQLLIDAYPVALLVQDHKLRTPLHHAIDFTSSYFSDQDREETVRLLVNANSNAILIKDKFDKTPLQMACEDPNFSMGLIQLMANARPEALTVRCYGISPYHRYLLESSYAYHKNADTVSMIRLHMIHGFQDILVNQDGNGSGNISRGVLDVSAAAIDLLKREHLARKELQWMNVTMEELSMVQSSCAAAIVFGNWLQEHWNLHRMEIEFIEAELKALCEED